MNRRNFLLTLGALATCSGTAAGGMGDALASLPAVNKQPICAGDWSVRKYFR